MLLDIHNFNKLSVSNVYTINTINKLSCDKAAMKATHRRTERARIWHGFQSIRNVDTNPNIYIVKRFAVD